MTERLQQRFGQEIVLPTETTDEVIVDVNKICKNIGNYFRIKREERDLTNDEYGNLQFLHHLKNQRLIDLLLIAQVSPAKITVEYKKHSRETIHPFSRNDIDVFVPSVDKPGRLWRIKTKLSDLRREGVARDSREAIKLIDDAMIIPETNKDFLTRTCFELLSIHKTIGALPLDNVNEYIVDELENISAGIIEQRLLGLKEKGLLPLSSNVRVYLFDKGKAEGIMVKHEGKIYNYQHQTPRLTEAVLKNGGYD